MALIRLEHAAIETGLERECELELYRLEFENEQERSSSVIKITVAVQ